MLNTYTGNETVQQQNAVATLIYHSAVSQKADFTESSTSTGSIVRALIDIFGYDKNMERHYRSYHSDEAWEAILRAQMNAGLPVCFQGKNTSFSHVFIADGYDNTGKFHFNLGYGGRHDGYYALNEMPQNLNEDLSVIINIKPDEGGTGSNEMALMTFSVGKNAAPQNETFTVTYVLRGVGYFAGGQSGVALVDNDGGIVKVIETTNAGTRYPGGTTSAIVSNCFVPETINAGQYRLRIVTRPADGEWKFVTLSDAGNGVPSSIDFTVAPAASGASGGGYGLVLEEFSSEKTSVQQNDQFTVSVNMRNRNDARFDGGQMGAALVDNDGNIVEIIGTRNCGYLGVGSRFLNPLTITCTVPATVPAGQYKLRIVIKPTGSEEWRVATLAMPDVPNSIEFRVE
jgi:hypothetical protein